MFSEDHPVIRRIVRERRCGSVICIAGAAVAAVVFPFVGAPTYAALAALAVAALLEVDILCIRHRVRSGRFGDNRLECEEVVRVVADLGAGAKPDPRPGRDAPPSHAPRQ